MKEEDGSEGGELGKGGRESGMVGGERPPTSARHKKASPRGRQRMVRAARRGSRCCDGGIAESGIVVWALVVGGTRTR